MPEAFGFERALPRVLIHEGGKVDDPRDPGGRTNQGVIQRVYDSYRRGKKLSPRDVYLMSSAERDEIYRAQYWDAISGDKLPPGIDYVVFDGAVNSGPRQSVKWLQRALGDLYTGKVDGVIGVMTLNAAASYPNHDKLAALIIERRLKFLKALKTWKTFGRGWSSRVMDVLKTGQAWAMGDVGPLVEYRPEGDAKAKIEDAKTPPTKGPGDAATGGGIVTGGLGGALDQVKDQLGPYAASLPWVKSVVVAIILIGGLMAVGGLGWRWWATRQKAALDDALDTTP